MLSRLIHGQGLGLLPRHPDSVNRTLLLHCPHALMQPVPQREYSYENPGNLIHQQLPKKVHFLAISDGNNGVIEGCMNVRNAISNRLFNFFTRTL